MHSKKKLFLNSRLYLILDRGVSGSDSHLKKILKNALKGGVSLVQFRDKMSSSREVLRRAIELSKICKKYKVPFIVNDRIDVAIACGACGLHLGQEDIPVGIARKILGPNKIIGLSCHSLKDIKRAQKEKADYLGFGPVFKTETKPYARQLGLKALKKALQVSRKPIFAIGGISEEKLNKMTGCKQLRIAVIRAICSASDPKKATKRLLKKINV